MYDLKIVHTKYYVKDKTIIWFWDKDNHNATHFISNNVFVLNQNNIEIWNMKNVLTFDDCCTGLIVEENSFYLYTFNGVAITMDINTLEVLDKKLIR